MTEAKYPQCRVVPLRMLNPDTAESFLNQIVKVPGIRRIMINGPNLPVTIPYGPARGKPNPHPNRRAIHIGDKDVELRVQVGLVTLEVEDKAVIEAVRALCESFFTKFPYQLQEGQFMKTSPSLVDYAKYGPDMDESIIGLVDPRRKEGPVILQGLK